MAKIGTIKSDGNGSIRTLKLNIKFKLERVSGDRGENEPTHRIVSDGVEIGAAWTKETREDRRRFLSITLDDPSFDAPLNLAAFPVDETEGEFDVVWNRPRRQQQDAA